MKISRMLDGDDPRSQEKKPSEELPPVPTGIQRLLRLAAMDEEFCRELVERRGDVADTAGVELTASEVAILASVPAARLEQLAHKMAPTSQPRRDFLRKTAATAAVLLGGAALGESLSGCDRQSRRNVPTGALADDPSQDPESENQNEHDEQPPERPENREMAEDGGISPDEDF